MKKPRLDGLTGPDVHRLHKYGLSPEVFQQMMAEQRGACAGCLRRAPDLPNHCSGQVLHVDHNHRTGKVRGLLCHECNKALGQVRDNPHVLRRLASYLEEDDSTVEAMPELIDCFEPWIAMDAEVLRRHLGCALLGLKPRWREVIELRYGLNGIGPLKLEEIGFRLGVSHVRVQRLQQKATEQLRRELKE